MNDNSTLLPNKENLDTVEEALDTYDMLWYTRAEEMMTDAIDEMDAYLKEAFRELKDNSDDK
jgi:hypothetical protein